MDEPARDGSTHSSSQVATDTARGRRDSATVLVGAAAGGNRWAWEALVERFAPTVWAVARGHRLGRSEAAEVSRITWLRLVEHIGRIERPERVGAWLALVARRESLRLARLTSPEAAQDARHVAGRRDADPPGGRPSRALPEVTGSHPEARDTEAVIAYLVAQLPERAQVLLRLLSVDSPLTYRDLSEALGMAIGSIGPTKARSLAELRRLALDAGLAPEDLLG